MSIWGQRLMPLLYDPFVAWAERAGMAELRRHVVSTARGRVLEIGAGTGLNLPFYGGAVTSLTLAEPEVGMAARLERRARAERQDAAVVAAVAEQLPFDTGSFDTVVSTLVLCTVRDRERALSEVARVLVPGGRLAFIEHVRGAPGSRLERWQDRLHGPWHWFAYGCDCNVATTTLIEAAGFELEYVAAAEWRRMPPIVRPLIAGSATPRA